MTESLIYADWFSEKYGMQPVVVRNIPKKITISSKSEKLWKIIILKTLRRNYRRCLVTDALIISLNLKKRPLNFVAKTKKIKY